MESAIQSNTPKAPASVSFAVKEIFLTVQGEGANAGRPAVFCRFSRCNLWSGREQDRSRAICQFCDTDFLGTDGQNGGIFDSSASLADAILGSWTAGYEERFVVLTGGEPLLQINDELIAELHRRNFSIAVETNGTIAAPKGLDWICVSPKASTHLLQTTGDELKVVYPQPGLDPHELSQLPFQYFFLSPMDGPHLELNRKLALDYSLKHPKWRVGVQLHKVLGVK